MLNFWASTPIGQEESAPEKKLREIGEWLVERTESKGIVGNFLLNLLLFLQIENVTYFHLVFENFVKINYHRFLKFIFISASIILIRWLRMSE